MLGLGSDKNKYKHKGPIMLGWKAEQRRKKQTTKKQKNKYKRPIHASTMLCKE